MVLMDPRKEGMVNEHTPSEHFNATMETSDVRHSVRVKRMQIQYA